MFLFFLFFWKQTARARGPNGTGSELANIKAQNYRRAMPEKWKTHIENQRERVEEEAPLTVLLSGALSHIRLPPLSYDYSGMSKLIWEFSIGSTKYTYDRHIKVCTALCVYSKFYLF